MRLNQEVDDVGLGDLSGGGDCCCGDVVVDDGDDVSGGSGESGEGGEQLLQRWERGRGRRW